LDLSECYDLIDAGIAKLKDLTSLQQLDLSECINLTNNQVNNLREKLRDCHVIA